MGILYALLFTRALHSKKPNFKHMSRKINKELKFWRELVRELMQLINMIFHFIFIGVNTIYKKCICQNKTVKEDKLPENVIKFDEYKLKKVSGK